MISADEFAPRVVVKTQKGKEVGPSALQRQIRREKRLSVFKKALDRAQRRVDFFVGQEKKAFAKLTEVVAEYEAAKRAYDEAAAQ